MLTHDELRAMPPAVRAMYLRQIEDSADDCEQAAEDWRADERAARERAERCEDRAAGYRAYRATLEAAGLWPVAAPATTALRGELLMSGQTEAIDALDRLAKGGER